MQCVLQLNPGRGGGMAPFPQKTRLGAFLHFECLEVRQLQGLGTQPHSLLHSSARKAGRGAAY